MLNIMDLIDEIETYNYKEEIETDIVDYLNENYDIKHINEELYEELYEELLIEDSITGNASGSYWCNAWKAELALLGNLDLLEEVRQEYGYECLDMSNPEALDVSIRCYLLPSILSKVLEELTETEVE